MVGFPYPLLGSPGAPSGAAALAAALSAAGGPSQLAAGPLLDQLSVQPTSAISTFRQLSSSYAGDFLTSSSGAVTAALDQSGNGRDYTQATGANQPVLETFGATPAIRLDSTAKYLSGALISTLMSASTGTIVALAYVDLSNTSAPAGTANSGGGVIADTAEGGALWAGWSGGTALEFSGQGYDGAYKDTANLTTPADKPLVMIWQHGAGTLTLIDGAGNTQTVALGDITYGAFNLLIGTSDSKTMTGRVFELLTFDQVLGATDLAAITSSMGRWIDSLTVDVSAYPNAATTGPTGTLTTQTGDMTVSVDGTVVENLDLNGKITVTANNVTIQNCRVLANGDYVIFINDGVTGCVIQDCEVHATQTTTGMTGIRGNALFLRNNIHNVENGITIGTTAVVTDNYIHDLAGAAASHLDGIESNGGASNILIRHNTVLNPDTETSCVQINDGFGASDNITVDDNYCAGGGYTIYVAASAAGQLTNMTVRDNVLGRGNYGYFDFANSTPTETANLNRSTGAYVGAPSMVTRSVIIGRGQVSTTSGTIATNTTSKRGHWVYSEGGIANLKCIDTKWYMGSSPTAGGTNTIKRYIEYPVGSGTFYQVKWAGATTLNRNSGGTYTSDAVAGLTLPAGWVYFEERTTATVGGTTFPLIELPAGSTVLGVPDGNDLTDKSHSGTIAATSGVTTFGAAAWFGDVTGLNPRGAVIVGDSLAFGQGDVTDMGSHYSSGYIARMLDYEKIGYMKLTKPGQQAADFVSATASITPLIAALPTTTEPILEHGINDLRLNRTKAQLETDMGTLMGLFAGMGTITVASLMPRVTSAGGQYTTDQAEATDGNMAARAGYNTDVIAKSFGTIGRVLDADRAATAERRHVFFLPKGVTSPVLDGTHLTSAEAAYVASVLSL